MEENQEPQTFEDYGCGGNWRIAEDEVEDCLEDCEWNCEEECEPGLEHVIDSELYFFWIMKNILLYANGNVLEGIHLALSNSEFKSITWGEHKNFIFSDGNAIWAFRSSPDTQQDCYWTPSYCHSLYWISEDDNYRHYKAVMTQPPTSGAGDWNWMYDRQLVYLPRDNEPIVISGFDNLTGVEMKTFHSNWNWVGFPRLVDNEDGEAGNNPDSVEDIFNVVEDEINEITLIGNESGVEISAQWNGEFWDLSGGLTGVESSKGYKVEMPEDQEQYDVPFSGARVSEDTPINLVEGENWVPYFILEPQRFTDAFPEEVLEKVQTIKSENWFIYKNYNGQFISNQICMEMYMDGGSVLDCHKLYYGSMYEVVVDENIQLIWNNTDEDNNSIEPPPPFVSERFPFEKKKDYLPVVIESVETENEIEEIGAKKIDKYVGAEFVGGFPVNMRVYDNNLTDLIFETAGKNDGLGKQTDTATNNRLLGISQSRVENGIVFVQLTDIGDVPIESPKLFSLVSAYPNPMNPGMEIHFNLMKDAEVELGIYDILGRKLTTLVNGSLITGNHSYQWYGKDENGTAVSSGIYFYRLQSDGEVIQNKIMLLK
tara:strand:+ start:11030 stop:12823 length:1794 start_codon:yes stop_codon:yes gene_type:complete